MLVEVLSFTVEIFTAAKKGQYDREKGEKD